MVRIRRLFGNNGIRSRVAKFTLILLLCLITGYVAIFYVTLQISSNFSQMFRQSLVLEEVSETLDRFRGNLESYLNTKDSDAFVAYLKEANALKELKEQLGTQLSRRQEQLLINNISHILEATLNEAAIAIDSKRARNIPEYIEAYSRVERYSGYVDSTIGRFRELEFKGNLQDYLALSQRIEELKTVFIVMTGAIIALSVIFIYDFTRRLTGPIEKLSDYATEISRGNYGARLEAGPAYREADLLSRTLSEMAGSISRYIGELRDKAEMEGRLQQAEIENLKMQNLLKNAEFTALQSQINPHFLFNTLNAGMQLAILEDAEKTAEFLDTLAAMFRYNIQSLENTVTLGDELENVRNYYRLMQVRFADMIRFDFEVDPEILTVQMPPLILQPLIENALIHGFRDKEDVGEIRIRAMERDGEAVVCITDNGRGIPEEKVRRMNESRFQFEEMETERSGHTTGLGLANVYQRLSYFTGLAGALSVRSAEHRYTEMQIRLPREGGDRRGATAGRG